MSAEGEQAATLEPSTRLCVKNIPKYVDEKRLRQHFSLKGEVTDVKIMKTSDGK
jgi:multiple RNA-binding domain-containing protein 1